MTRVSLALLLLCLTAGLSAQQDDICWKQSYGRGVGTIPNTCANNTQKDGLLCYPACRSGFSGVGPVCWQDCPSGFTDTGGHCTKPAPYGRGAGYPWKFGDAVNDTGMYQRCEADHGKGGCEKDGAIVYPKCKAGFHKVGCCVCTPDCPSGMTDVGVGCQKQSYGRTAGTSMSCSAGLQNDAGLCYTPCRAGTTGVGPVCWNGCPADHPVNCGASCAKSADACAMSIVNQVQATGELALNVALLVTSAGAGNEALAAARTTAKQAGKSILSKEARQAAKTTFKKKLKDSVAHQALKNGGEAYDNAKTIVNSTQYDEQLDNLADAAVTSKANGEIDIDVLFAMEDVDPTGIIAVVNSFNKPICGTAPSKLTTLKIPLPGGPSKPAASSPASRPAISAPINSAPRTLPPVPTPAPATPSTAPPVGSPNTLAACKAQVQGRIAWDAGNSNRTWAENNVNRLCQGTSDAAQPGRCFDRVMHGNINWGGGTVWAWANAIELCAGTNNSDQTVACFQRQIAAGKQSPEAIESCKKK